MVVETSEPIACTENVAEIGVPLENVQDTQQLKVESPEDSARSKAELIEESCNIRSLPALRARKGGHLGISGKRFAREGLLRVQDGDYFKLEPHDKNSVILRLFK